MSELGFRHFVGIDYSKGMLVEAAKTGLYEDLKLVKLGTEKVPAQAGTFTSIMALSGNSALNIFFFLISFHSNLMFTVVSPSLLPFLISTSFSPPSSSSQVPLMWWRWSVVCNLNLYHLVFWGSCAMSLNQVTSYSYHQTLCCSICGQLLFFNAIGIIFFTCSCPSYNSSDPSEKLCDHYTKSAQVLKIPPNQRVQWCFFLFAQVAWFVSQRLSTELTPQRPYLLWRESYSAWRRTGCGLALRSRSPIDTSKILPW